MVFPIPANADNTNNCFIGVVSLLRTEADLSVKRVKTAGRIRPPRVWNKRAVIVFAVICAAFAGLTVRLANVMTGALTDAAAAQDTGKIVLGQTRGCIYDRNGARLVNTGERKLAAVLCCAETLDAVNALLGGTNELKDVRAGSVIAKATDTEVPEGRCARNVRLVTRDGEGLCRHILGYTDGDGKGVSGIEAAFDTVLRQAGGTLYAEVTLDAQGRALAGDGLTLRSDNYDSPAGLVLTIDCRVQRIAEEALAHSSIICGAVVVQDCSTGELLACVSVPAYDTNNLKPALTDENLPFLNRAVSAYPVGSVFKPFIAAAALNAGQNPNNIYECAGRTQVGAREFRCFNGNAHGGETLNEAVVNSCNCYFIEQGLSVGAEGVINTCAAFGFGRKAELFPGDGSQKGNLPASEDIQSDAQLANLCFGQGELLVSPVQMAAAYSALANGGTYYEPYILKELIDENGRVYGYFKPETEPYRVIEATDCRIIGRCLYNNMIGGTGAGGRPANTTAAGKTATAQTGRYDESGVEQLCTWFAGYFPYTQPRYTVVVFNEKGRSASMDCAPVFKEIAEGIMDLRK